MKWRVSLLILSIVTSLSFLLYGRKNTRESFSKDQASLRDEGILDPNFGDITWAGSGDFESEYGKPETDPARDLELVVECWWQVVLTDPGISRRYVADNAGHTAQMLGQNSYKVAYIRPDHPAINDAGELLDRWGMPLFFHRETGRRIGLRSAGPDREMWNEDDVVYTPQ